MDKILYTVNDHGMDGRGGRTICFASFDKIERDVWYNASKNKAYYTCQAEVLDMDIAKKTALRKLSETDKLVLGL